MPEIIRADFIPVERWDAFVESALTNGEFVSTRKYLGYHAQGKFNDVSIALVNPASNDIIAVFPAVALSDRVVSHAGTSFAGLIINNKCDAVDLLGYLDLVVDFYKNEGFQSLDVKLPPLSFTRINKDEILWAYWNKGFEISGMHLGNIITIDYASEEQLLNRYGGKRRNQVRKVIKDGHFQFFPEKGIPQEMWESMTANLSGRYGTHPTHDYSEIMHLYSLFPDQIKCYMVKSTSGAYAAAALVYEYKSVFHTQYLDMNYELSNKAPHVFLTHNLLLTAQALGKRVFSFGPSTEEGGHKLNEGLYDYKNQYGQETASYFTFHKKLQA